MAGKSQVDRQREALARARSLTESEQSKARRKTENVMESVIHLERRISALEDRLNALAARLTEQIDIVYKHIEVIEQRPVDSTLLTKSSILAYMRAHNMLNE